MIQAPSMRRCVWKSRQMQSICACQFRADSWFLVTSAALRLCTQIATQSPLRVAAQLPARMDLKLACNDCDGRSLRALATLSARSPNDVARRRSLRPRIVTRTTPINVQSTLSDLSVARDGREPYRVASQLETLAIATPERAQREWITSPKPTGCRLADRTPARVSG